MKWNENEMINRDNSEDEVNLLDPSTIFRIRANWIDWFIAVLIRPHEDVIGIT